MPAVPGFVARGGGTIVNIASIVAIAPEVLNGVYGGTKAFVLALSHSLQHELADKGLRVQAVLPGATATEFWDIAGLPVSNLPAGTVMSAADMVDAALAGLDQGEIVTIPTLPDKAEWDAFEASRQAMSGRLSSAAPAARYNVAQVQSAGACMTNPAKAAGLAGILAAATPALPATDHDQALREGQAVVIELDADASAMTYWVRQADGWHVVTTVDTVTRRDSDAEEHAIVRFSAVLQPGESQLISVPFAAGEQQQVLRIRRLGNQIEVARIRKGARSDGEARIALRPKPCMGCGLGWFRPRVPRRSRNVAAIPWAPRDGRTSGLGGPPARRSA